MLQDKISKVYSRGLQIIISGRIFAAALLVSPVLLEAQESFTEATVPAPLLLRPGLTTITGGVTVAGGSDVFYLAPMADGTVTFRLRYTHRSANIFQGITEHAYLAASVTRGDFYPPDTFLASPPSVVLGTTFYLANGQNTLTAAPLAIDVDQDQAVRVVVSAPSGKVNPAYTIEVEHQPSIDSWDSSGGNDNAATAVRRDANLPDRITGTVHSATDQDWFRFEVPEGRTLFLYANQSSPDLFGYRLRMELLSGAGFVLQSAQGQTGAFAETAGPGGRTYYMKMSATDGRALEWGLEWRIEDLFEPNDTIATARSLGSLAINSRLEARGLTTGIAGVDYFSFVTNLPANTRILVAASDDPFLYSQSNVSLSVTNSSEGVEGVNTLAQGYGFTVISAAPGTTVLIAAGGNATRYRLLIKVESAYDRWHQTATLSEDGFLSSYIPPDADIDGDGLSAALEWAFRGSLFARDALPVSAPSFDGSSWRVTVSLPSGGLAAPVRLRESTDLISWADVPASRTNLGGSTIQPGRIAPAVVTLTRPGQPRNFMRLEVDD